MGRSAEVAALEALVASGPLAIVTGPGGVGKSALVREVVHRRLGERRERAVVVRARKEDDFDQLGVDILRALTLGALGEVAFDSPDELAASVLDAAERQRRVVVLEDMHHVAREDRDRWLDLLACYAQESLWIVTSRARPALIDVQELVVELGPLPSDASRQLARSCRRNATDAELDELVEAGAGSPFWIRQLAASATDPAATRDLLDGLPAETLRYVAMLSMLQEPVRHEHLPSSSATREVLEQRGILVADGETHRLHDAAADHVVDHLGEHLSENEQARARKDAAEALGSAPLAGAQLEAFRLFLVERDLDTAQQLLGSYREWIAAGLGPRLWNVLSRETEGRFERTKLHVALEVGSHTSLSWLVAQPAPLTQPERLAWIHGLLRSGRPKPAMEELETLAADGPDDVQILYARALCDAGYPHKSAEVLRRIEPRTRVERARRDLHLAMALFHADDSQGSARLLEHIKRELDELPPAVARELSGERRGLLMQLGLRDEVAEDPGAETRGFGMQSLLFYVIRLAASGRFSGSSRMLAHLTKSADLPAGNSVLAGVANAILRVGKGDFRGLDSVARNLVHETEQLGNATLYHWAYLLERVVNLGRSHEKPELAWAESIPPPTGVPERYLRVLRALHAARRGEPVAERDMPVAHAGDGALVECICQLTEAVVRLVGGDAERAAFLAAQITRRAVREGYTFLEGEALVIRLYADLALGRRVELARGTEELSNLAAAIQSRRYRVLARLVAAGLGDEPDIPMLLATLHEGDAAPMAARVAAALLGGPESPDAMDRLLIDGLRARWRSDVRSLVEGRTPAWVVDPGGRLVHLPDRTVKASPLAIRILEGLFAAGGATTLSGLAALGWELDEYHQLRDSKRVHVAIRRLRQLIEDDPSVPARVVTTDSGYGLALEPPPGVVQPRSS